MILFNKLVLYLIRNVYRSVICLIWMKRICIVMHKILNYQAFKVKQEN